MGSFSIVQPVIVYVYDSKHADIQTKNERTG